MSTLKIIRRRYRVGAVCLVLLTAVMATMHHYSLLLDASMLPSPRLQAVFLCIMFGPVNLVASMFTGAIINKALESYPVIISAS
jgi:hypothetical protein